MSAVPDYQPVHEAFHVLDQLAAYDADAGILLTPEFVQTHRSTILAAVRTEATKTVDAFRASGGTSFGWLTAIPGKILASVKAIVPTIGTTAKASLGAVLLAAVLWFLGLLGPQPAPVPPVPPIPTPVPTPEPPPVVDVVPPAVQQSIQAAYESDLDPNKSTATRQLADLLKNVVAKAKSSGSVKTHKDLQTAVKQATDLAIGDKAIPKVRAAVGAYLASILPTDPNGAADEPYWAKADTAYSTIALALNGVRR